MDVADYSLKIAPYVVAVIVAGGSWLWGRVVIDSKDAVLRAKDDQIATVKDSSAEVLKTKDAHIEFLERLRPARLVEELDGLKGYYAHVVEVVEKQRDVKIAEIESSKGDDKERKALSEQVSKLKKELAAANRAREAAEELASSLRTVPFTVGASMFSTEALKGLGLGTSTPTLFNPGFVVGSDKSSGLLSGIGGSLKVEPTPLVVSAGGLREQQSPLITGKSGEVEGTSVKGDDSKPKTSTK